MEVGAATFWAVAVSDTLHVVNFPSRVKGTRIIFRYEGKKQTKMLKGLYWQNILPGVVQLRP